MQSLPPPCAYSWIGVLLRRHDPLELQVGTSLAVLPAGLERDFAALADGDELLFVALAEAEPAIRRAVCAA